MKKNIFLLISVMSIFTGTSVHAALIGSSSRGTTSAEFLRLGVGGRAAAMGEAYTAVADEASAMYWNPGALTQIPSRSLTVMHALYLDSSYFDYLAFVQNLGSFGAVGVSYQYFTPGSINQTDITGTNTGSFSPSDQSISLGYAYKVAGYGVGLSVKSVNSKIVNSASTVSGDVGLITPAFFNDHLTLGATGRNLFGSLKYRTESVDLPTEYRVGGLFRISENWGTSLDVALPTSDDVYTAIGTEYLWGPKGTFQLATRAGYNTKTTSDVDGFTGVSFGLGFLLQKFSLDYGFVPFGDVGTAHRFSLNLSF